MVRFIIREEENGDTFIRTKYKTLDLRLPELEDALEDTKSENGYYIHHQLVGIEVLP